MTSDRCKWLRTLITSDKGGGNCVCPRLSVCLSVSKITQTRGWIWMKCCVSTEVGIWTNWLTFEPDPNYSPDAGTGLLSPLSYKRRILRRKIRRIRIGRCYDAWFYNGFIHWVSEPSKRLCRRYMRSTECPSSFVGLTYFYHLRLYQSRLAQCFLLGRFSVRSFVHPLTNL